jgi:hypothetical protein
VSRPGSTTPSPRRRFFLTRVEPDSVFWEVELIDVERGLTGGPDDLGDRETNL